MKKRTIALFFLFICVNKAHGLFFTLVGIGALIGGMFWGANEVVNMNAEQLIEHPYAQYYMTQHPTLDLPKVAFVNIDDYCETRDLIGVDDEKVFVMLTEDYTFYEMDGTAVTIPAGFIFDGASVPDKARYFIYGTPLDTTLLAPGLIHDYMYRHQNRYSYMGSNVKFYADWMLLLNTKLAENHNPEKIWGGVDINFPFVEDAHDAFDWHANHQDDYDRIFTDEYYKHNLEIYEKYGKTQRWTTDQLFHRAGVSIDNDDCNECKIGGKDPNIVDNRKKDSSGSDGTGGAGSGSGGGGGSGEGNGSGGTDTGTEPGAGNEGGTGPGTVENPAPGDDTEPGVTIDPGYELPVITSPLPDFWLPSDGTKPWNDIVGFETAYSRVLYLLSGDVPDEESAEAFANEIKDFATGNSKIKSEFNSMWKSIKNTDWQNLINKGEK